MEAASGRGPVSVPSGITTPTSILRRVESRRYVGRIDKDKENDHRVGSESACTIFDRRDPLHGYGNGRVVSSSESLQPSP